MNNNSVKVISKIGKVIHEGSWSMVYDEGFAVQVPGFEFFTFFMYEAGKKV